MAKEHGRLDKGGSAVWSAEQIIGRRINALRMARGWSQQELATRMSDQGYSWRQTTVAKTEAADRPIRVNEVADLAAIFDINIHDVLSVPIDDSPAAQRACCINELSALASVASQRVRECERSKRRAEAELAEATAEARQADEELQRAHLQPEPAHPQSGGGRGQEDSMASVQQARLP